MNAVIALMMVLSIAVCDLPAWGFSPPGPGGAQAMTPLPHSGLGTNLTPSLGSPPDVGSPPNLGKPPDLGSPPDVGNQSIGPGSPSGSNMGARSGSETGAGSRPSSTRSGLASPATPGSTGAPGGP